MIMSDSQLFTEYKPSTSSTSLSQEPWNKVQSSYAAKRKQIQEERMKQLKELEDKVTETTNWNNQKRKEWIYTSRGPIIDEEQPQKLKTNHLEDATLEDLEDLIAASAKRLASYRLRNQKSTTQKSSDEIGRWRELLEDGVTTPSTTTSSSSSQHDRLSNTKHYNLDPIEPITTSPLEKSSSYLRVKSIFENNGSSNSNENRHSWKKDAIDTSSIIATRSTVSNASPKIESPRISSSTTPRATTRNLRKLSRISPQQDQQPRTRKLSSLSTLHNDDQKSIDEYLKSYKQNNSTISSSNNNSSTTVAKRKVKLSITSNMSTTTANSASITNTTAATVKKAKESKSGTVVKRKRGKTLPGSLATPPAVAPLTLPPMKVEPLIIPLSKHTRNLPKTPTRIPLPGSTTISRSIAKQANDDEPSKPAVMKSSKSKTTTHQLRKPKSNTILTPKLQVSKSNKSTDENLLRKNSITDSTAPQPVATGSTSIATSSALRVTNLTNSVSSKSILASNSKRKVSTLQERLQGMVNESKSWTAQLEQEKSGGKSEIVLRGKGLAPTESEKKTTAIPKVLMRVAMTPEAAQKLYQFNLTSYEKLEMM
ncbi:hypothetical protein CU097_001088, partial [Rhizopus azygosporus]